MVIKKTKAPWMAHPPRREGGEGSEPVSGNRALEHIIDAVVEEVQRIPELLEQGAAAAHWHGHHRQAADADEQRRDR